MTKHSAADKKTLKASSLLSYTGMASAFLAVAPEADAQIVYTDVDPDAVLTNAEHEVDFDGDGNTDLTLQHLSSVSSSFSGQMAAVALPSGNAVMGSTSDPYMYPAVVGLNSPIGPAAANWQSATFGTLGLVYFGSGGYGNWLNGEEGFLGVKFMIDGETHYGWVELEVADGAHNITVRGFAYQATPDEPINAGDQGIPTGIRTPDPLTAFGVAPNPAHDRSRITFTAREAGTVQMSLLNSVGQVLRDERVRVAAGVNTVDLALEDVPAGAYFVRFQSDAFVSFRQLTKH